MSGAPLIALWPSGFAYLLPMNHGLQETRSTIFQSSSLLYFLCSALFYSFSVIHSLIFSSFSSSVFLSPLPSFRVLLSLSVCSLDPAPCIPSCLIKTCIINTAISLSIFLPRSYDCYIKCKLFRCNSPLMSLLQSVFLVCRGKGGQKKKRGREYVTGITGFYCNLMFDVWLAYCRPCN